MPCGVAYVWDLKCDTNGLIYETLTDTENNRLVVAGGCGQGVEG